MVLIPNFHVALIHFPIALILIGVAAELVCAIAYRQSTARAAGRWMILLGIALSWPALYSGIAAIRTLVGEDFSSSTWNELRTMAPVLSNPGAWEALRTHLLINAGATFLSSVVVIVWLMSSVYTRERLQIPALLAMLLVSAAILVGAWHGGELVYYHNVTGIRHSDGIEATTEREVPLSPKSLLPPVDTHITLAGFSTGLCLLAWGVAARSRRVAPASELPSHPPTGLIDPQQDRIFAAFQPATVETVAEPPRAMLGWIAAGVGVLTAVFGVWVLSDAYESRSPTVLYRAITRSDDGPLSRRLAHFIAGVFVIVLPILLGWVGSRSRTSRWLPMGVGVLLLIAVCVQTWFGILLLVDSNFGPLWQINP